MRSKAQNQSVPGLLCQSCKAILPYGGLPGFLGLPSLHPAARPPAAKTLALGAKQGPRATHQTLVRSTKQTLGFLPRVASHKPSAKVQTSTRFANQVVTQARTEHLTLEQAFPSFSAKVSWLRNLERPSGLKTTRHFY